MDKITVLTNAIILLLKSKDPIVEEKVKDLLEHIRSRMKIYNGSGDLIKELGGIIETLLEKEPEDKDAFIDNIKLLLSNRKDIIELLDKYRKTDLNKNRSVKQYLIRTIDDFLKKENIIDLLQQSLFKIKTESSLVSIEKNMSEMLEKFTKLINLKQDKGTGVVEEVDIDSDDETLSNVVDRIKKRRDSKFIYKTGWECINTMLQGGLRLGEFTTIAGLQHNYKTGFTLSLFTQIVTINEPIQRYENKKPLAVLFSLEDENESVFEFIYRYLKITYDNEVIEDFQKLSNDEIVNYIKDKLKMKGWSVKIIRMDPNEINWFDIKRKIDIFTLEGYDVQVVFIDYLSQIRKDGLAQGPVGNDIKDLFKKARNFANINKILLVTPHQLSQDANQLLRNQLPPLEFVKHIANRNYYDGSKKIAQEIDLELYIHIAKKDKKPVLTVQRGKHRGHPNIDDNLKYVLLEFVIKNKAPIPADNEHYKPCIKTDEDDIDLDI